MRLLIVLYSLTGATSLAYQLAWSRLFSRELGATLFATSAVVAWYLVGLALGLLLFGPVADRLRYPLRIYGLLEAAVGLYALVSMPFARHLLGFVDLPSPSRILLVTGVFLLPPTVLMGGSFPAMLAASSPVGQRAIPATLYAANTAGAVGGVILTAFFALPRLGLARTVVLAAIANLGVASVALACSRFAPSTRQGQPRGTEPAAATTTGHATREDSGGRILLVLALSGFSALLGEIAWTRALSLVLGSSVYAFATVLAAFLLGIGGGSLLYARRATRQTPLQALAHYQTRAAVASGLFAVLVTLAPSAAILGLQSGYSSPLSLAVGAFTIALVATGYATTAFGASFPAGIAGLLHSRSPGRACGLAFALNTLGAVAGALLTAMVFIPGLGLSYTLALGVATSFLAATIADGFSARSRVVAIVGTIATFALLPLWWRWNQELLISGVYAYAYRYATTAATATSPAQNRLPLVDLPPRPAVTPRMMFAADGAHANVAVYRDERGDLSLLIDGKADASTALAGDMRTQLLLGHLPALFRPAAQTSLVIGLGSGVTVSALLGHDVRTVDVVEIEPLVAQVASTWFRDANRSALDDRRVQLIINDGRRWVRSATGRYDIITSEPSNLWMSGVSHLFTSEFFAEAKASLRPQGVLCQWMHLYQVSTDDVRMVLRGLRSSFSHAALFLDGPDLLVLASDGPLADMAIDSRTGADLARVGVRSAKDLDVLYLGDEFTIDRFSGPGVEHTDDRPLLEFTAPLSIARDDSSIIVRAMEAQVQK